MNLLWPLAAENGYNCPLDLFDMDMIICKQAYKLYQWPQYTPPAVDAT